MSFLEWTPVLDVHVDDMNNEHKKLIDLMNIVYDMNEANKSKQEVKTALTNLANYTVKHFSDEEKYMESISYPKLSTHKIIHQELLKKVNGFIDDFDKGDGSLPKEFFDFLKRWLVAHIKGIDIQYGDFKS